MLVVVPVRSSLTDRLCDSPADFHSFNDYFDQQRFEGCGNVPHVDLWDTDHPAADLNATGADSPGATLPSSTLS